MAKTMDLARIELREIVFEELRQPASNLEHSQRIAARAYNCGILADDPFRRQTALAAECCTAPATKVIVGDGVTPTINGHIYALEYSDTKRIDVLKNSDTHPFAPGTRYYDLGPVPAFPPQPETPKKPEWKLYERDGLQRWWASVGKWSMVSDDGRCLGSDSFIEKCWREVTDAN